MIIDSITTHKSKLCNQPSIPEMVAEIRSRYEALDLRRQHLFVKWLWAHSSRVKSTSSMFKGLTNWFESMQPENLRWEFHLIVTEINWWCHLDEQTLTKILIVDLDRDGTR